MTDLLFYYRTTSGFQIHHHSKDFADESDVSFTPAHSHYTCEVFLLLAGNVTYIIDGEPHTLHAMDMIVVRPGEMHYVEVDRSQPYERIVFNFSPNLFPPLNDFDLFEPFNKAKSFAHVIPKEFVEKYHFYDLTTNLIQICKDQNRYLDLQILSALIPFATSLNECIQKLCALTPKKALSKKKSLVQQCITYINEHLTEPLTAKDLSKALNISVSHIRNTFQQQIKMTVQNYILHSRMQLAQKLLTQNMSPQQVANFLHYDYYSTFYYHFVKCFRHSPQSFSNSGKQVYNHATGRMRKLIFNDEEETEL